MSKAGWYPDPGGQQGMFRWWDGSQWTPTLTSNPYSPPPGVPTSQLPMSSGASGAPWTQQQERPARKPWAAFAVIGVVVVAMVLGGWALLTGAGLNPFGGGEQPASNPTANVCPTQMPDQSPAARTEIPGRVVGGQLSYPELGAPWGVPTQENRVAFGRDVWGQSVMVEPNYDGSGASWVASIVVGELVAGDGFFSPEQGAEIVTRCLLGEFYGDAVLDVEQRASRATTVDGKDAWLVELHLGFDIEGLNEKGETAIVLIVATSLESSSIFYASIPDSTPALLQTAREVQTQLRVEE